MLPTLSADANAAELSKATAAMRPARSTFGTLMGLGSAASLWRLTRVGRPMGAYRPDDDCQDDCAHRAVAAQSTGHESREN